MNRADIEMVNQSMNNLGNSFLQNRELNEQHSRNISQELLRQKMLELEQRRSKSEEDRNANEQTRLGQQDDQNVLKDMITVNPFLTDEGRASANSYLKTHPKWGAVGIQLAPPEKKPLPQVGQSAGVAELTKAREFRDRAGTMSDDPDAQKWYLHAADILEKRAEQAKPDTAGQRHVSVDHPEVPETPGVAADPGTPGGLFGIGSKPPRAAIPGKPGRPGYKESFTLGPNDPLPSEVQPAPATGQAPATAAPGATGGKVRMISPKGVAGFVPSSQVEKAKAQGYKLAQ